MPWERRCVLVGMCIRESRKVGRHVRRWGLTLLSKTGRQRPLTADWVRRQCVCKGHISSLQNSRAEEATAEMRNNRLER
jgi:hypothetical protein